MDGFKRFWDANTMAIGIVCTLAAVAVAAALDEGQVATVLALIGGTAFMWLGKPDPAVDTGEDD